MPLLFESGAYKALWPRVLVSCSSEVQVRDIARFVLLKACSVAEALHTACSACGLHLPALLRSWRGWCTATNARGS